MVYVPLHQHTQYSHDGKETCETLIKFCVEQGIPACAITDHGTLAGVVKFAQAAKAAGIKNITGCEIYYQPVFDKTSKRYHMTVLVMDEEGYGNLCEMMSDASRDNYYTFPIVTDALIEKYHRGLIFTSGCISSYVSVQTLQKNFFAAQQHMVWMKRLLGDRYLLEVQPFPVFVEEDTPQETLLPDEAPVMVKIKRDIQKIVNLQLVAWSDIYALEVVMTADSHYAYQNGYHAYRDSLKLRHKDDILADYSMRFMHTGATMLGAWKYQMKNAGYPPEYLDNTGKVAARCQAVLQDPLPVSMPDPEIEDQLAALTRETAAGMRRTGKTSEVYKDRIRYEMRLLRDKGYIGYFLIVNDLVQWCINQNIMVQVRGSAGASMIAYCLQWHDIDPVIHDLPFNRFISEERSDLPDVDLDVNPDRREEVINYILTKYPGRATQIATFNRWQHKNLINALLKVYEVPGYDGTMVKHALLDYCTDNGMRKTYQDMMVFSPALSQAEIKYPGMLKSFVQLLGTISNVGTHAAGVVISSKPIARTIAIQRSHGRLQIAVEKEDAAYLGLVKIDVLGVRNLAIIHDALTHAGLTWKEEYYDDPVVYADFAQGKTYGIFQFGKSKAMEMCRQARVSCLADVAIVTACNRPEPLKEQTFEQWLVFKKNPTRPARPVSWWNKHTGSTFVFQETVMQVCQEAGFTALQVDKMLKMLKKYTEETPLTKELRVQFVAGMLARHSNLTEAQTKTYTVRYTRLFENMRRYLFNKAHAWAYAAVAVKEVWIRTREKLAWYLASLRHEPDKLIREQLSTEAVRARVYIVPPHVNGGIGYEEITLNEKPFIQEGLTTLDNVGDKAALAIVKEREARGAYSSVEDFLHRFGYTMVEGVVRHYKPKEMKQFASFTFAKGISTATITALLTSGALEFDPAAWKQKFINYNKQLANYSVLVTKD